MVTGWSFKRHLMRFKTWTCMRIDEKLKQYLIVAEKFEIIAMRSYGV
jgi:hypothetical protein